MLILVYDKCCGWEVFKFGMFGNKFELFEDCLISWDVWDIDIFFEDCGEVVMVFNSLDVIEDGLLWVIVEIIRVFWCFKLIQCVQLIWVFVWIDFVIDVDWYEIYLFFKVVFLVVVCFVCVEFEI